MAEREATGEAVRAFLALDCPAAIRAELARLGSELSSMGIPMRRVAPEAMHLTLKFFGNLAPEDIRGVTEVMEEAAALYPPLSLSAKGLGAFPGFRNPRVVWVGLFGDTLLLEALAADLESRWPALGIAPEDRPFRGHFTVGRMKDRVSPEKMAKAMTRYGAFETPAFTAEALTLYKSELLPGGPRYTVLAKAPLTGKPREE